MSTLPESIKRRAGGRRKYNAARARAAAIRRHTVAAMLANGLSQSAIAAVLSVNKGTICRDARAIGFGSLWGGIKCPYCKRWYSDLFGHPSPQCNAVGRPMKRKRVWWMA